MIFRARLNPDTQIRFGMVFLIVASFWRWFAHPGTVLSPGMLDGVSGFLYGVSIALMLLGVWRKGRGRSQAAAPGCR